jgi:hypothetical protein
VIRDVSPRGIGLVLRRRFEVGAVLLVEPFGPAGQAARLLPAKVVRVDARGDRLWFLGCEFVTELGEDEVRALGQPARWPDVKGGADDRGGMARRHGPGEDAGAPAGNGQ